MRVPRGRARVLGRRSPGRPQADSAPRHGALVVDAVVVGGLRVEARRVADGGEAADGRRPPRRSSEWAASIRPSLLRVFSKNNFWPQAA